MAKTDISRLGQDVAGQDVTCGNTIVVVVQQNSL